ncbi:type I-B CRISPR-associated protein Cas7/Csh2 [Acetivibrio clariflavus]|uniref:CRISPR-associated protein, Csh2 family n=1 Tax=Acetivibrio clariflavus (strain DSM 19732 / NBRC 101661 / EBR45) TaxID=720554 RepID=G8LX80_ACECE|nr:type I-B CRISPR-associated protein Cas7/Csh2 [Acetivibrio clariflavus]AEV68771.1 CRISPR-associated protein, Csh2 family [Acetivibrio clariflavus DSM 19732]HOQ02124.1 type I-B CRISPR-associated protein Cas7/Csh2 [Acetivibrio clariflavus]HPU42252.1 type I-B CRISPR-associated protein Cas7/Csh2 [Acetivibrio clariflavus]
MIKNRQEILFLYDVTDANPNGDPLDENKPRIDEETGVNIVTDVRLKRTIRDYLFSYKGYDGSNGKDIFVRELESEKGGIKDGKARAKDFNEDLNEIIEKAIDIRLFGGVIPLDKASITFTGPVQFGMGRSLNKVSLKHIKGTGAFASGEGKAQKTFREEYILPYSLIGFHGIVNENAAKETRLSDEDVELLDEAMWNGTKNLITRSKMGHMPRLMLRVVYKAGQNFFIGDLQNKIELVSDLPDEKIRSVKDFAIKIDELVNELVLYKDRVEKVVYIADKNLKLVLNGQGINLKDIKEIKFEEKSY